MELDRRAPGRHTGGIAHDATGRRLKLHVRQDGATADRWVNWRFETSFDQAGDYKMIVRARTADGVVSPVEASLTFHVI